MTRANLRERSILDGDAREREHTAVDDGGSPRTELPVIGAAVDLRVAHLTTGERILVRVGGDASEGTQISDDARLVPSFDG